MNLVIADNEMMLAVEKLAHALTELSLVCFRFGRCMQDLPQSALSSNDIRAAVSEYAGKVDGYDEDLKALVASIRRSVAEYLEDIDRIDQFLY